MRIDARIHHPAINIDQPVPSHLVVSVSGEEGDRARPPLGLVLIVDRSGSMGGTKHATVRAALDHLIGYLDVNDVVSLVAFSDCVEVALAPTIIGAGREGERQFTHALDALRPHGGTALDQGLMTAISLANQIERGHPEHVVRVVLLTDGQANVGSTDPDVISGRMASAMSEVSLSTIGVGVDCDHDLLGTLARTGRGSYGFVETPELAAEVLGTEIGGLVNLDAANVVVTVAPNPAYARIGAPLGVATPVPEENGWCVRLGHLVAGQTRTVVFPLAVLPPRRTHARAVTVVDVTAQAKVEGSHEVRSAKPKIHFTGTTTRDEDLDETIDIAIIAQAQSDAERAARRGDWRGASQAFQGSSVSSGAGAILMNSLAVNYASAQSYTAGAVDRTSYSAVLDPSGGSVGVSSAVGAVMARTMRPYVSAVARAVGLDTASAVLHTQLPGGALGGVNDHLTLGASNGSDGLTGSLYQGSGTATDTTASGWTLGATLTGTTVEGD